MVLEPMKKLTLSFMTISLLSATAFALPSYQEVRQSYVKSDSLLLDRHGEIIHELRTDKERRRLDWTPLKNISPVLREAVIQAEDKRFYEHGGVDYRSIGAALIQGLTSESLRGASTITMQLASLLDKELQSKNGRRSIWQKERQILNAWEIEKKWSKAEVLEAYLNLVTFRGELQGMAAASRALFEKDPHGLDQSESLILASLIRSPNASSMEVSTRGLYLNRAMNWQVADDHINAKVRHIVLGPHFLRPQAALAPHIARQLLQGRPHGRTVACTLDSRIQRFGIDRLTHHLLSLKSQNVKDGAVLVLENSTGDVLAYVSHSGEPSYTRFVDGVQAKRQAGSTLKPFLYGLAFDQRILTPASLLDDSPLDIAVISGIYQPRNYDSQFKGFVTSRIALASSLNVPAVKTLSLVGVEPFLRKLRQLGIKGLHESGDFYGPSLALGSADVSLWELTNAYRCLASEGQWSGLRLIREENGPVQKKRIFSKEATFLISDILSDREARSATFGLENPLSTRFWTAVKTGTSKDMRDNWCIGYSRKYTVGVWTGNFSGEPMWNVSGVTGAAPIWTEMMDFLHRDISSIKREALSGLVRKKIEFSQDVAGSREEWFIRGTEPNLENQRTGQFNPRILYPPSGTVIAVDPDIPPELQKVFFVSQTGENNLQWVLNGTPMEKVGKKIPWTPKAGKYSLAIANSEENILDYVYFEVKGSEAD
ncbi:MAG: penicillin-binding protein 1C [Deltaproteobacteria bacterium RBG_16_48_10]|nr:MAG: penicillin-binding protein 1C [Deltaproteobacteria bacterium RBG_16_48_10]